MARVASPLDRWAPYSRDDARDERTSFSQPQQDFGGFSSTSFNASSQRPTLSHLRLDSDSGINYGPGAAAAAAAAVAVRRSNPRTTHSMDAITSANDDTFYRSPDQYQQSAPLPAAFSSPDGSMSMDWVSSAPPTSQGRPTTAGHQSRPSYFGEPQYDSFGAVVGGDASVNLQNGSHASPPTQSTSYPYSPPGSFASSSASYMQQQQQQQQARQRGFSNRTDASSPAPTANSTATIDPSLQDAASNNIWVSSAAAQAAYNSGANQGKPTPSMSRAELEAEITRLRQRVSELEIGYHWSELKVMKLEAEAHRSGSTSGSSGAATSDSSGSRSPAGGAGDRSSIPAVMGGVAPSEEFAASWRNRTDARIKRFCALNRAGNALCAWHDSRRERRAYPPRQAPPGFLNCGCTNEEGSWLSSCLVLSLLSLSCLLPPSRYLIIKFHPPRASPPSFPSPRPA